MGVAPGVGIDVDAVAVLCKSVDEGNNAGSAGKDSAPLLEAQVGGDHGGAVFMSATDDVVEEVGGASIAGQIPKLVQDQQIRVQVAFQSAFEGGQRFLLKQVGERGGEGGEADAVAAFEGSLAEYLGEHGLADAGLAAKEDVVAALNEVEAEQAVNQRAINLARVVPVESVDGLEGGQRGGLSASGKVDPLVKTPSAGT